MKKAFVGLFAFMVMGFTTTAPKTLYVQLTQTEWSHTIDVLEYTKNAIRQSDLPIKTALPLIDSLTSVENTFLSQLQKQLTDTTKK